MLYPLSRRMRLLQNLDSYVPFAYETQTPSTYWITRIHKELERHMDLSNTDLPDINYR